MSKVRWVLVLSENWTIVDPNDMKALVRIAQEAEGAGIDAVMLSEHIVLGRSAGSNGVMANPREYAYPGNQPPDMSWPNSIVLLSAIAAVTEKLRLVGGAIIAPLRHPLLLAKEIATLDRLSEGRFVMLPTVSWHEDEYAALAVPFNRRGAILDEQLEVLAKCWQPGPVTHHGEFYNFDDVWVEPRPQRDDGPRLWFGGQDMHAPLLRRLVKYGHGFNPLGVPSATDMESLKSGLKAAGRSLSDIELVGGINGKFATPNSLLDLDRVLEPLPAKVEAGFGTICFKPSMYIDDAKEMGAFCRSLIKKSDALLN
ncbi:MAG: TIGR03619 family F420-dependent LLM class oxidoreductase [Actinomycetes bacterium]